jgi:hypothetical protein
MKTTPTKIGLRQRILAAESNEQIIALLKEGEG